MADPSSSGYLLCRCGAGVCPVLTSTTHKNPGRPFYGCPAANRCGFFKWVDQVLPDELIDVPLCACGAGICRLDIKTTGPNAGRKVFVCPIKKGQGACNYLLWLDAHVSVISPQSTPTNCSSVSRASGDLVEERGPSNMGHEIDSLFVYTPQCPENLQPISGMLKRDKIMCEELKGSDDTTDDSLRKHCKRPRHGDPKSDGCPSGSSSVCLKIFSANLRDYMTEEDGQASSPTFETEFHHRQGQKFIKDFTLAVSENLPTSCHHSSVQPINTGVVREFSWIVAAIHQNLSSQIQGWWGRLAFPPSKCLVEQPPGAFFCCVFPCFDPIFVPPNVDILYDSSSASTIGSPLASKSKRQSMLTLYVRGQLVSSQESSKMRDSVSNTFVKAAEQLQNDLLTRLWSLGIEDHEIMFCEAETIFYALDQLQVDHKIFSKQVKEFIQRASLLDKIDQSIKSDNSCQMLADYCNYEKLKLVEINDAYARAVDAFSVSRQRAASLTKEVNHLKDRLFQTEAELYCCEAESTALEVCMSAMLEDKENFEQSFQSTCKTLDDALKLRKQREAKQRDVKAEFEKAKVLLWG